MFDLVGCRVEDEEGSELGKVADVQEMPSADLLVIRNGRKEVLIPLVGDFVTEVLVSERRVLVAGVEDLVRTGRNRK